MKKLILALLINLPLFSFSQSSDESEIYRLFFKNSLERSYDSSRKTLATFKGFEWKEFHQLVVIDSTLPFTFTGFASLNENLPELEKDTYKDFNNQNRISEKFSKPKNIDNIVLVSKNETAKIMKGNTDGWNSFYEKYPESQGILKVSNIGFNKNRDQALLFVENRANRQEGLGYFILFTRIGDLWKEDKIVIIYYKI